METTLTGLLFLSMAAVVVVLLTGILTFVKGGDFHRRNANKLMNIRVIAQGTALFFFVLLFLFRR
jgi:hypothetical protein